MQAGRLHQQVLIVRTAEVADKEAADALRGLDLYAPREAFAEPADEDEFYLIDLIGLTVRHVDGSPLGRVKAVQNFGAGDLLEIEPAQGASYYLPFTRAAVPEVRIAEGVIVADPPAEVEE